MTVTAIDIGSNSIRILTVGSDGEELRRAACVTGLATGVDRTGRMSDDAITATINVLERFATWMRADGTDRVRAVATSACRDAANGSDVMALVEGLIGVEPEIISGADEAALAFRGASAHAGAGPHVVVDIGGGSTEVIIGSDAIVWHHSYDIGSVRLTDWAFDGRPVAEAAVDGARAMADEVFSSPAVRAAEGPVLGVAGTFTSVAAIDLGLDEYRREAVDRSVVERSALTDLITRLARLSIAETAAIPSLDPGRARVLLGGAIVAERVLHALGASEVTVSEHDLLDGVALGLLDP